MPPRPGGGASRTTGWSRTPAGHLPLAVLLIALAAPGRVCAQDSVTTLRAAASAQRAFESARRAQLPIERTPAGACDFRAGRTCFWYDASPRPGDDLESEELRELRRRLLEHLDDAAMRIPGDDWIAGQRVRYRVDAGDTTGALLVARECRASRWWCAALGGFAAHVQGDYVRADSAFAVALAQMPVRERCEWTDLSRYLGSPWPSSGPCEPGTGRDSLAQRFWRLAKPLHMIRGNDARTEHLARHVMAHLEQQARGAYGTAWGQDVQELLLRFGWPVWWSRRPPRAVGSSAYEVVGHERVPSWYFHPRPRALASDTATPAPGDWRLAMTAPPARYAPAYASVFREAGAQVQLFRRGESTLVIAAFDARGDTALSRATGTVALALERSRREPLHVLARAADAPFASWSVTLPWRPIAASAEYLGGRQAVRARLGIPVTPDDEAISGLLLASALPAAGTRAEQVASLALPTDTVRLGQELAVFWEMYGWAATAAPLDVSLFVQRLDASWLARAAGRLRLRPSATPIRVRWRELARARDGIAPRALRVELASQPPGRYRILLRVEAADVEGSGTRRTAQRERYLQLVAR